MRVSNMAKFREFNTKKEADAYAFELQNSTPVDATCFVAFFEKDAPRICATFALAQAALAEGALDHVPWISSSSEMPRKRPSLFARQNSGGRCSREPAQVL